MAELKLTKDNFEELVIKSEKPIIVDFWATWCGPCKMLAPVLEEVAKEVEDRVNVGKVNIDEEVELAEAFGITSIPTVVYFKDGKPVKGFMGYRPKEDIMELMK